MVRLEVHASQARQLGGETEDPPHISQAPGVDGLVVIAHEEDVAALTGQQHGQIQLCPVEVLGLIHEEHRGPSAPAPQERRIVDERWQRPSHEIVEVEGSPGGQAGLVLHEGLVGGDVFRGRTTLRVQLEPGEGVIQPAQRVRRQGTAGQVRQQRVALHEAGDIHAGVGEDGPPERVEGAHSYASRGEADLSQGHVRPLLELLRRAPIEGQGTDACRVDAVGHAPRDPRYQRGRLARACRGHAEDRARGRGGRRALVRRQPGQPLTDGRRNVRGLSCCSRHGSSMRGDPYRGPIWH